MAFTHNSKVAKGAPAWGSVAKARLPRNAYADMGEAGKKSTWGYPHHWVENGSGSDENGCYTGGTMYLHEGGLDAAWAAAHGARSGQKASAAVIAHLQVHRKALGKTNDSKSGAEVSEMVFAAGAIHLEAAEAGAAGEQKPVKINIEAYGGKPMFVDYWGWIVADLSGIQVADATRLVEDHNDGIRATVGLGRAAVNGGQLTVSGELFGETPAGAEFVALARRFAEWMKAQGFNPAQTGIPMQASVGLRILEYKRVEAGATVTVNGQTFTAPTDGMTVMTKSILRHVGLVGTGADFDNRVSMAARAAASGGTTMSFDEWVKARGFDPAKLTDQQKTALQADFKAAAEVEEEEPEKETVQATATSPAPATAPAPAPAAAPLTLEAVKAATREAVAEAKQDDAELLAICGEDKELLAKATKERWTPAQAALAVVRKRPQAPALHGSATSAEDATVEAALCLQAGLPGDELVKALGEKTVEAARKTFPHGIGLQQMLMDAAWQGGWHGRHFPRGQSELRELLHAGFSTTSLPNILSGASNRILLAAYSSVENTWRQICSTRNVSNFFEYTSHRLTGSMKYEKLGPGGEIKSATVGEENFGIRADTFAKLFSLTYQNMVNDDLGAFNDLTQRLGRGSALAKNDAFWAEFLDNSTFFTGARGNYASGADTALSLTSLEAAELLFLNMTDADGEPLAINPDILLVPTDLKRKATDLMASQLIVAAADSTGGRVGATNTFQGNFRALWSAYMRNATLTGYSSTAWYLLANPADGSVIEAAFLNGRETPIVESTDADFDTLGIVFRGYDNFGFRKQNHRYGIKMKGAA